jgi:hypothetical protein
MIGAGTPMNLIWPAALSQACPQFPGPAPLASRGAGRIGAACVAAALPPARTMQFTRYKGRQMISLHLAHQSRMVLHLDNRASSGGSAERELGGGRAHYEALSCPNPTI